MSPTETVSYLREHFFINPTWSPECDAALEDALAAGWSHEMAAVTRRMLSDLGDPTSSQPLRSWAVMTAGRSIVLTTRALVARAIGCDAAADELLRHVAKWGGVDPLVERLDERFLPAPRYAGVVFADGSCVHLERISAPTEFDTSEYMVLDGVERAVDLVADRVLETWMRDGTGPRPLSTIV